MKKSLLILSFLTFFFFQKVDAQSIFFQPSTYSPTTPLSCNDLNYTMFVRNYCNNYTLNGITHTVSGFTIDININYSVGLICLGAIQSTSYTENLGMLPAGVYTITAKTFLNGVIQDTQTQTVTVTTCCSAIASFTSNKTFGCVADVDSFTFTNTSLSTSNAWYVNDVLMATTTDFTTALNTQGLQTIKLVSSDATCSDSTSQTFEIYDNPMVNLGTDINSCIGEDELLSVASGFASYSWSTGSSAEFIWVNSEDNYYVTVTNSDGCMTTDSNYVTYNALPTPSLGNDTTICQGETLTLDAGSYSAYAWNPFASTPTIDVTTSFPYSVTVTDANGCQGKDTLVVTVNSAPTIMFADDTVAICAGETTTLMAPGTYDSYVWSTAETTANISVAAESNYSLTVTTNSCENTDDIYVKVNALPTVDLGMDTIQNCSGSSATIDAGNNFASYAWSTSETSSSISATTQGTYSVTVTDANNCTDTDDVFVNENALPIVDLGADQELCSDAKVTLNAGSFSAYLWNDASTNATNEVDGSTLTIGANTLSVEVTDANTCIGSDEVIITVKTCETGISSVELENNISINPNPAVDFLILASEKYSNFEIEIYSTLGELVLNIENFDSSNKIDVSNLQTGVYFLNITTDNKRMVKQFVKAK